MPTRVVNPSLMNGRPVVITTRKNDRSDTFNRDPTGLVPETRETPSRSIHPSPPVNSFCFSPFCSRAKYLPISPVSVRTTEGAFAIVARVES